MYKLILATAILLFSTLTPLQNEVTIYIIGDSTAANKSPSAAPETGWGMALAPYFDSEVKVDNRALNGRSTKSFINEKRWDAVLTTLKKGDYVFIQFGHNDEKIDKPGVGTSLEEYKNNLIKFVKETQERKAFPVLLTPIMRRNFKNGVFADTHLGYPGVVRKLADSLHIPLIDMHRKTEKLIVGMGEIPSKKIFLHLDSGDVNFPNFPKGKKDDTHLSPFGAKTIAGLAADGVRETKIGLATHLLKK